MKLLIAFAAVLSSALLTVPTVTDVGKTEAAAISGTSQVAAAGLEPANVDV